MTKSLLILTLLPFLCLSCSKKQETPVPQQNAPEAAPQANAENAPAPEAAKTGKIRCGKDEYDAEAVKGWICLNGVMRCLDKNGCQFGDQTAPMRSFLVGNTVKKADEAQINVSACEPTRLMPGTTCKDDKVYCGDAELPGGELKYWRCLQNQWMCVAESCSCGSQKTGKFGTCKDGVAYCGDKEMTAPKDEGYICQNGKWVCANPKGCDKCEQYQSLGENGKCEGKSQKIVVKRVECEQGNCPCGDGACPKGGACLTITGKDPICTCGEYKNEVGCESNYERPIYSNKYGEFTCDSCTDCYSSNTTTMWHIKCENEKGCHIQGEKEIWKSPLEFGEIKDSRWCNEEAYITIWNEPEKYHLVKGDDYNAALKDAELSPCGRKTASEFKQTCMNHDRISECHNDLKDSCDVRTACDTMPVPRADRGNFSCEFRQDKPFFCVSWIQIDMVPGGLRCNADSGCTCHHEICAKGQLCVDGVCRYDTIYAQNLCQNIYPHLAPDETSRTEKESGLKEEARLGGVLNIYSPSDSQYDEFGDIAVEMDPERCPHADAYDIPRQVFVRDKYSTDVSNKLVTPNGTCLCGYSEVTPKKLSDYKCVQSLGYVCINPQGCACGNAQCQKGALCLREGVCSPVVMDKGVAPEKITDDVETWCKKRLEDEFN
ncbi:MAG: hypothetical protein J6A01_03925 [Proteobacteria bacterium]|nr:hypothetical protein [Pseudomonadota bacterium]